MPRKSLIPPEAADFDFRRRTLGRESEKIDPRLLKKVIAERLTAPQRDYLTMYFFDGLKISEIAKNRGVARSTVSRTIKRAKKRILDALKYCVRC